MLHGTLTVPKGNLMSGRNGGKQIYIRGGGEVGGSLVGGRADSCEFRLSSCVEGYKQDSVSRPVLTTNTPLT